MTRTLFRPFMAVAMLTLAAPSLALAQAAGPPNALQGFSQNRDQPVKIDAATLEVRDKNKTATFSGNVQVVQGDTTLRCRTLAVFYDSDNGATGSAGNTGSTMTSARPGPGGQSRIRRLEAKGGVTVIQKDQTATGETGIFDMASNTVTLSGNVVVKQGENILRGDRLVVDLTSGAAKVESGKSGTGRVQGMFLPSSAQGLKQDQKHEQKSGSPASEAASPRDVRREPTREAPRPKSANPSGLY
jgi:lipopolysaccharide export system protein LptA